MSRPKVLTATEVSRHNQDNDAFIVVGGNVFDVTDFHPHHPGGAQIILDYAGSDATDAYNEIHSPDLILSELGPSKLIGVLDPDSATDKWRKGPPKVKRSPSNELKPPLRTLISAWDFEEVASKVASPKAWAFYSSAATDCITRDQNKRVFDQVWFRPRLMRNVSKATTRSRILGCKTDLPFFISPAAMAKLVHPEGEKDMARAAVNKKMIQCISSNASFSFADIIDAAASPSHPFFFQLYVNRDRSKSEALLKQVKLYSDRIRAIFVTIDNPVPGKREADERVSSDDSLQSGTSGSRAGNDSKGGGLGRIMGSYIDSSLSWADIAWLKRHTKLPIVVKGVQSAADACLAAQYGCAGIMIGNHGGRNLDTSPPSLLVLLEMHRLCPEVFGQLEVMLDGGIRRGTDMLKAICLGATAVGLGRPYLYSLIYGQEGVEHLTDIVRDELMVAMQLVGITNLENAHPGLVNTAALDHLVPQTEGHPYARDTSKRDSLGLRSKL
ncbi:MAG: hypothetical protein M1814_006255 [Vezdaea aestivalis]|nr:MAG: hypothetical protein M1814_006255 [Vezdaea aestivalis]